MLSILAVFSVMASGMPRAAAWPLAVLALAYGAGLGWWQARRPARWIEFGGQDAPVRVDGRPVREGSVTWRGPLAFLRWRSDGGHVESLAWWPDTLPAPARRELRLAAPVRRAARRADSVAP